MESGKMGDDFVGLPMEALIGAPLSAACKAQIQLGNAMLDFVKMLAYEGGKEGAKTNVLDFDINRPVIDEKTGNSKGMQPVKITAPVLGLVPLPALLIEDVTIDFEMEVKNATKDTAGTDVKVEASASYPPGLPIFKVSGTVSAKAEHTRSTDKSAKYTVHVEAKQQQPPEGMAKLLQAMASAVEPYAVGK